MQDIQVQYLIQAQSNLDLAKQSFMDALHPFKAGVMHIASGMFEFGVSKSHAWECIGLDYPWFGCCDAPALDRMTFSVQPEGILVTGWDIDFQHNTDDQYHHLMPWSAFKDPDAYITSYTTGLKAEYNKQYEAFKLKRNGTKLQELEKLKQRVAELELELGG